MSTERRVAFIGCGKRAQAHVAAIKAETRGRVVAVADAQAPAAQAMAGAFGSDVAVYTDYQRLLAEARPDVVITCLWTPLHLPVFRACLEAGVKAVLSEKPMAPTWGECCEIAQRAERSGCLLTFCHQRRFAQGNRLVRQWLGEGRFGAVQRMDLYSPQNLLDCGTHTFDQALSFNGESPAKWVLGAVDPTKLLKWFDVEAESLAVGTVVFQNGVRAAFQVGGPDMDLPSGVRVHGSEGFVEVNWDGDIRRAVVFRDPSWTPPKIEERPENHMFGVIRNAFDCLESGAEPELSWRKALRAEEIIFALYESVRRRAAVELPLTGVTDNPFHTLLHQGAFASAKGARGRALAKIAGESIVLSQVADGAWAGSNLAEIFPATGDTRMACGIHELFASETVVEKAPVDDVLYILEGEIEIDADGVVETYRAGDVAYLRAGSRQKFTVRERVKHLYVTDPCDWSNG